MMLHQQTIYAPDYYLDDRYPNIFHIDIRFNGDILEVFTLKYSLNINYKLRKVI